MYTSKIINHPTTPIPKSKTNLTWALTQTMITPHLTIPKTMTNTGMQYLAQSTNTLHAGTKMAATSSLQLQTTKTTWKKCYNKDNNMHIKSNPNNLQLAVQLIIWSILISTRWIIRGMNILTLILTRSIRMERIMKSCPQLWIIRMLVHIKIK